MKILITALLALLVSSTYAQNTTVTIEVQHIQPGKGSVIVSLYNSKETFFKTPAYLKSKKADKEIMTFALDVPSGTYAISVFQDLDNNGKLKQGIFNIPKEPIGLGNNFKPKMSAPAFKDCAVNIASSNKNFTIILD